jgi:hypothetical protein
MSESHWESGDPTLKLQISIGEPICLGVFPQSNFAACVEGQALAATTADLFAAQMNEPCDGPFDFTLNYQFL